MWHESVAHQTNAVLRNDKTKSELISYLHASCFSPVPSTFLQAAKMGYLEMFPGLTPAMIKKHLKPTMATAKGHMDQEHQNVQSTNITEQTTDSDHLAASVISWHDLSKTYSDQTGRFPVPSCQGNNYIFVLYHYNANGILVHPLKNRSGPEIAQAWSQCTAIFNNTALKPDIHIMDNECSNDIKQAFKQHNITYQLVPPHMHRRNAAERAIRTFKNHFIAGLATCDPEFPLRAWDLLLPQAQLTLNLLRTSRINPALSAHQILFGNYNFNATPIAPPGTKVLVHEKPDQRASFAPHGITGWYVGPAPEHYRCYKVYIPSTNKTRITDTVQFFPHATPFPATNATTYLQQTASDMLHILQQTNGNIPSLHYGSPVMNAFIQIAQILKRATSMPTTPPAPPATVQPESPPTYTSEPLIQQPEQLNVPTLQDDVQPQRVQENPTDAATKHHHSKIPFTRAKHNAYVRQHVPRLLQHRYLLRSQQPLAQTVEQTDPLQQPAALPPQNMTMSALLKGPDKDIWNTGLANEIGRLAQGVGKSRPAHQKISGTNTIKFIRKAQVPKNRTVTYANFVCDIILLLEIVIYFIILNYSKFGICEFNLVTSH